jgi:hypothetical protein
MWSIWWTNQQEGRIGLASRGEWQIAHVHPPPQIEQLLLRQLLWEIGHKPSFIHNGLVLAGEMQLLMPFMLLRLSHY